MLQNIGFVVCFSFVDMFDFVLFVLFLFDGCYVGKVDVLCLIFFEYGLIKVCIMVEVEWLLVLVVELGIVELVLFFDVVVVCLCDLVVCFSLVQVVCVKEIECIINYDVKVVEYFIKEQLKDDVELVLVLEFVYFVCISEDINNFSYGLMLEQVCCEVLLLILDGIVSILCSLVYVQVGQLMLLCIYGQIVLLIILGKELVNVVVCLECQCWQIVVVELIGKINGVVGNYNVYVVSYLDMDWLVFVECFVIGLGLVFNLYIMQIELYDNVVEIGDVVCCVNIILIDLVCDIWGYILLGYFKQCLKEGEVGLLMMLYKVNLIDFENVEGNFGIVNVLFEYFSVKLLISCWQCDLIDFIVLCVLGIVFGYSQVVLDLLVKGLGKLEVNLQCLDVDLDVVWEVLVEVVQMVMCCYGLLNLYEQLKVLICGQGIMVELMCVFVQELELLVDVKQCLLEMILGSYIGLVELLVKKI